MILRDELPRPAVFWNLSGWAAVILALLPLAYFPSFYIDWYNHVWMVAHYASAFREHGQWPSLLSAEVIEAGSPSLYGFLFYRLLSLPALVVGADPAIRLVATLSMLASFFAWRRIGRQLAGRGAAEVLVGLAVAVAPYVLTNLYNRSALTEYFAQQWTALALAGGVRWVMQPFWPRPAPPWVICGIFLLAALVAGTHPITTYLTLLVVVPCLAGVGVAVRWRPSANQIAAALAGASGLLLLTGLWLRDTILYSRHLELFDGLHYFSDSIDHPLARLSPVPVDFRTWQASPTEILTPFLEAPVNLLLWLAGVAALVLSIRDRQRPDGSRSVGALLAVALFIALATAASLDPALFTGLAPVQRTVGLLLEPIQYAYRLAGPVQLAIVLFFLGAVWTLGPGRLPRPWLFVPLGGVLVALAVKIAVVFASHGITGLPPPGLAGVSYTDRGLLLQRAAATYPAMIATVDQLPCTFYSIDGYALRDTYRKRAGEPAGLVALAALKRDPVQPWRTVPAKTTVREGDLLATNIVPTPFIRLFVSGRALPAATLRIFRQRLALDAPSAGSDFYAAVSFRRHVWLNTLPWLWLGWGLAVAGAAGVDLLRCRRAGGRPSAISAVERCSDAPNPT